MGEETREEWGGCGEKEGRGGGEERGTERRRTVKEGYSTPSHLLL